MVPQIWYSDDHLENSPSECDCDCACSEALGLQGKNHITDDVFVDYPSLITIKNLYVRNFSNDLYLVWHSFITRGVLVLNRSALDILDVFREPNASINRLKESGIEQEHIEKCVQKLLKLGLLKRKSSPLEIASSVSHELVAWIHVTNKCNLRCTYCYLKKTSEQMDVDVGLNSIQTIFRSAIKNEFSAVKLKYSGGEATLNFSLVVTLHEYARELAKKHNIQLSAVILTNGIKLDEVVIHELKRLGIKIMISLDGMGDFHDSQRIFRSGLGSFSLVTKTLDVLSSYGITPHISVTITDRNVEGLPELTKFLLNRQLPFSFNFYRENSCSIDIADLQLVENRMIQFVLESFQIIKNDLPKRSMLSSIDRSDFRQAHKYTCGVGRNYLVIDQNGLISKCQMELGQSQAITDVFTEGDPMLLVQDDNLSIQNISVEEKEGCKDCRWKYQCTGGCPLQTWQTTGRYDVKSPNCNIYKNIYPELLEIEAARLVKYFSPYVS